MPLCISSRKCISRGSQCVNFQYRAIDEFLRNLIKYPLWVFDICISKRLAYCMHVPLQSENFG
ncbi:hypothetical protein T4B_7408 [Trichinella pseudospiralis]|uniref:Uncharacterized protein n=1 Tax=Trichinella pseudospiralis TaxID=6337 RepID=A0A0V1GM18_TRIPS|nr:hypothetical protein T4B_7408 [Trichinella pseudospiralis]